MLIPNGVFVLNLIIYLDSIWRSLQILSPPRSLLSIVWMPKLIDFQSPCWHAIMCLAVAYVVSLFFSALTCSSILFFNMQIVLPTYCMPHLHLMTYITNLVVQVIFLLISIVFPSKSFTFFQFSPILHALQVWNFTKPRCCSWSQFVGISSWKWLFTTKSFIDFVLLYVTNGLDPRREPISGSFAIRCQYFLIFLMMIPLSLL